MTIYSTPNVSGPGGLQSLANAATNDGDVAVVGGYFASADGGGGEFCYQATPPGSATIAASAAGSSLAIASVAAVQSVVVTSVSASAVVTTPSPHPFLTGQRVTFVGTTGLMGAANLWTITRLTATTFSLDGFSSYPPPAGSGGIAFAPEIVVTTGAPNMLVTGQTVAISGTGTYADGQAWIITVLDVTHFVLNGSFAAVGGTGGTAVSTVLTTVDGHGLVPGQQLMIAGTGTTLDGYWPLIGGASLATSFSVPAYVSPGPSTGIIGDGGLQIPSTTTPGRWIRSMPNGQFNVLWFGANGDGTTANDAAVATAIASMQAAPVGPPASKRGNLLYFPMGDYRLDRSLGPLPPAIHVGGDAIGDSRSPRVYSGSGSRLLFSCGVNQATLTRELALLNSGVGVLFATAGVSGNWRNGAVVENLEVLGRLDTGYSAVSDGAIVEVGSSPLIVRVGVSNGIYSWVVRIIAGGALGTSTFQYSTDGGVTWLPSTPGATASLYAAPGSGIALKFPGGAYTAGDTYTWASTANISDFPIVEVGTSPLITRTGTPNSFYYWLVQILSATTFWYSTDGGNTFSAPNVISATFTVPNTGVTLNFPAGAYVAGDQYTWSSYAGIVDCPITEVGASPLLARTGASSGRFAWIVKITTGGGLGAAEFQYSTDGGATFSPTPPATTAAAYVVPGTGITLEFPGGTYNLNDFYEWATYRDINECGIEILGDGEITLRNLRLGGHKYEISVDGGELTWISNINFDGGGADGKGYQDRNTNLDAIPGFESACSVRIGEFKFAVGGSANVALVENCNFNGERWGVWHASGIQHTVRGCGYEGNWAVITGGYQIHYEDGAGEGATTGPTQVGHIWLTSYPIPNLGDFGGAFGLQVNNCYLGAHLPAIYLSNAQLFGLTFFANECYTTPDHGLYQIHLGPNAYGYDFNAFGNQLPSTYSLLNKTFSPSGFSQQNGTPINHLFKAQGALDVALYNYSTPLLQVRAPVDAVTTGHVHFQKGAVGGPYVGANGTNPIQSFDQHYSPSTGLECLRKSDSMAWSAVPQGASLATYGGIDTLDHNAGVVIMTVTASYWDNANGNTQGYWRIRQLWQREGGPPVLQGPAIVEASQDLSLTASNVSNTSGTGMSPIVVTTTAPHNFFTGDRVSVSGVGGNTAANGTWTITVTGATTFTFVATGNGNYTSGGTCIREQGYTAPDLVVNGDQFAAQFPGHPAFATNFGVFFEMHSAGR